MQIMYPAHPGLTMKDHNEISSHLNDQEREAPLSAELKDNKGYTKNPGHGFDADVDDFNINEKEAKVSVAAGRVHTEMSHKDSKPYADGMFLESDLPELIVRYKDGIFHAVKDICVDDGTLIENKSLIENVVSGGITLPSSTYKDIDVAEEANTENLYEDGLKSLSDKNCGADVAADCTHKSEANFNKDTATDSDAAGLGSSPESDKYQYISGVCSPETPIQTGDEKCNAIEMTKEIGCDSTILCKDLRRKTSLKRLLDSSKCSETDSSQNANEISNVQCSLTTEELNRSSYLNNELPSADLESANITFNVNSPKVVPSTREEIRENAIVQQLKPENKLINNDGISDNLLSTNNQIRRDEGESSFSAAGTMSDPVPSSGHVPFSGSISIRSDSSTTSTRSFAFPVLPNEWNSSPVRMAKADRAHLRKHRGCSLGLFCCRF